MGWRYYNHAMIPDGSPDEDVDVSEIKNGSIWKREGTKPMLARWTTDFDCGYETNWWYVIKDDKYDILSLKSKRRYEITKGRKNFEVKVITPSDHAEELYEVQVAAFSAYPEKYRPTVNHDKFVKSCSSWSGICLGAFHRTDDDSCELCGYSYLSIKGKCIDFSVQKTKPEYEREGLNAALVDGVLTHFENELASGIYICDGARSISHETAFQDYLERYFGFRKAYCKLNIVYRPSIRWMIPILFVFRKVLKKLDGIGAVHLINSVLMMEEIRRKCE